jgi:hypothetical protein
MLSALGGAAAATIARSLEDYRDMAVQLLHRPLKLKRLRDSLIENWTASPLFDVGRWVLDIEVRAPFVDCILSNCCLMLCGVRHTCI